MTTHVQVKAARIPDRDRLLTAPRDEGLDAEAREELEIVVPVHDGDGRIETSCPDCGEPIALEVRGRQPDDDSLLFHVLVPAAHWWDDIVFT